MTKPTKGNFKSLVDARKDSADLLPAKRTGKAQRTDYTVSLTCDLVESFAQVGLVIKNVKDIAELLVARGWIKVNKLN